MDLQDGQLSHVEGFGQTNWQQVMTSDKLPIL
jgi:hypothetical protein